MKTLYHYFSVLITIAVMFASCSKGGTVGPTGATGPTGPAGPIGATGATGPAGQVGPAGPAGANGQNGSIIYSGTTTPSTTIGIIGDYYLNTSNGLLYGPKTAAGWGSGFSLVGPAGATGAAGTTGATGATGAIGATGATGASGVTGAAGSQIYSGNGAPPNSLGVVGDYYLDKTSYLLYGPKAGPTWDVPISLQGPQGPMGTSGITVDTLTVPANQWQYALLFPLEIGVGNANLLVIHQLTYQYADVNVTDAALDNGIIMAYINTVPDYDIDIWEPMPLIFPVNNKYNYNFEFQPYVGGVGFGIFFSKIDPAFTLPNLATYQVAVNYRFKILVIQPQAAALMALHHVDINNYYAVSKILGLWKQDKFTINHAKL